MLRTAALTLVATILSSTAHAQGKSSTNVACAAPKMRVACAIYDVSLVQLIATPDRFHNKTVRVVGYAHIQGINTGLYLSREAFDQGVTKNAAWLEVAADSIDAAATQFGDRYVRVTAVWNAHELGNLHLWSGSLERVRKVEVWGKRF
ncbi:MAG: hypothetical protein ABJD07_03115 [Gemmatimonadaceae bacterium]